MRRVWAFYVHTSTCASCFGAFIDAFCFCGLVSVASMEAICCAVARVAASACTTWFDSMWPFRQCLYLRHGAVILAQQTRVAFVQVGVCFLAEDSRKRASKCSSTLAGPSRYSDWPQLSETLYRLQPVLPLLHSLTHSGLALPLLFLSSSTFLLSSSKPLIRSFASSFFFSRTWKR